MKPAEVVEAAKKRAQDRVKLWEVDMRYELQDAFIDGAKWAQQQAVAVNTVYVLGMNIRQIAKLRAFYLEHCGTLPDPT